MMHPISWAKRAVGGMALLAIVGLACSDPRPSRAADTGVERAPIVVTHSLDLAGDEQAAFPAASGSVAKNPLQGSAGSLDRGNPLQSIPMTSLNATRERPIFSPSRRPSSLPRTFQVASTPSVDLGRPNFSLVGAISGEHEDIAILRDETTKAIVRLRTGESHSGWTLQMAKGREIILQKSGKTAIVTLPNPTGK